MTVRDALKKIRAVDGLPVMYRMIIPIVDKEKICESDELIGFCRYEGEKLVPEDGDSYDVNDTIDRYELMHDESGDYLIVWERKAAMELPIAEPWFSMILSGEKKEEYREIKPYWYARLKKVFSFVKNTTVPVESDWDKHWIRFRNGYGKGRPSVMAQVTLRRDTGKTEWGAEEGKEYYVLKIHNAYQEPAREETDSAHTETMSDTTAGVE